MSSPFEVRAIDPKTWGLYLNDKLIGTSKLNGDAMLAKHTLDAAFQANDASWKAEVDRLLEKLKWL